MPNQHTKAEEQRKQSLIDAANKTAQRNAELMREKKVISEIAKVQQQLEEVLSFVRRLEEKQNKTTK